MLSVRNSTSEPDGQAQLEHFGPNLIPRLFQSDTLTMPAEISTAKEQWAVLLSSSQGRLVGGHLRRRPWLFLTAADRAIQLQTPG
jgi:hypothetical protein